MANGHSRPYEGSASRTGRLRNAASELSKNIVFRAVRYPRGNINRTKHRSVAQVFFQAWVFAVFSPILMVMTLLLQ